MEIIPSFKLLTYLHLLHCICQVIITIFCIVANIVRQVVAF